jgi:hypothetical protein
VTDDIPRELLDALRSLTDEDLSKMVTYISQWGWQKSVDELKAMVAERRKGK